MRRRDLLKGVAAGSLASALPALAAPVLRRVRPGDPGWPSEAAWRGLGEEVGGRLIKPVALTAPCETDAKGPCDELRKNLANPYYIGDQPGGTQVSGWLDAWAPKLSAYAVAARSTADVVAAVNFARRHNLRLVVKGGGTATRAAPTPWIPCCGRGDARHRAAQRLHARRRGRTARSGRLYRRRRHVGGRL